jgi:hypothetical protein
VTSRTPRWPGLDDRCPAPASSVPTYSLDQVNQGYADIEAGRVLRGVMTF